jgi:phenylacetate-coenzyme A ligase PaaK-like adenylate-forming protein
MKSTQISSNMHNETCIDKIQIAEIFNEAVEDLITHPPKEAHKYLIRSTSGTTGKRPLHIVFEMNPHMYGRFDGSERLLGCIGLMNIRLSSALLIRYGSVEGQRIMCLDHKDLSDERVTPLLNDFAPDMVYGMVFFLLSTVRQVLAKGLESVHSIILTGEYLTASLRASLQGYFPNAVITEGYGSTEAALINTSPCGYLPPHTYHFLKGITVDINEPDEDGVGEVLISWKVFRNFRARRYKIGDSGKLLQEPCRCGESVTLQLMGRIGYDYLKLAGALLRKEEFDRVAALCKDLMDDYRAEAYSVNQMERIVGGVELQVYRSSGMLDATEKSALAAKFSSELFVTPTQTLADLVAKNAFIPLQIKTVTEPFAQSAKAVKLRLRQ